MPSLLHSTLQTASLEHLECAAPPTIAGFSRSSNFLAGKLLDASALEPAPRKTLVDPGSAADYKALKSALKSRGFAGWFPNPEEQQVAPPEGQESMEIQKAEEAEEAEEDPLSQALQEAVKTTPAGDSVSSDAAKQLKDMKEKASESLEAEAPAAGGAAAVEAVKDDGIGPPDVDNEHGEQQEPMMTTMWHMFITYLKVKLFFMCCALLIVPCVLMNKKPPQGQAPDGDDELEEHVHDPRAPLTDD